MIAIFKPVNNNYGFDIRDITETNGRYFYKMVKIEDYIGVLDELPVLKCKKDLGKKEYRKQLRKLITGEYKYNYIN